MQIHHKRLTNIQYCILEAISPGAPDCCSGRFYPGKSKLEVLMGVDFFDRIAGKVIIDFASPELAPIKRLRCLHNRLTREFTTATVRHAEWSNAHDAKGARGMSASGSPEGSHGAKGTQAVM
jgi:hypothetical protein